MHGMYNIEILPTLSLPSKDFPIEKWLLKIPVLCMLYVLSTATITPESPVLLLLHITYAIKLNTAANYQIFLSTSMVPPVFKICKFYTNA
jgi:hypothetical protein